MKVYKYSELSEANLSIKDLSKPGKDGMLRGDVLVSKIENDDTITVNPVTRGKPSGDKSDITILNKDIVDNITDDNGNYDPKKGEKFFKNGRLYGGVIQGDDDAVYRLNDVEKTSDFGTTTGAKRRSDSTRIYETLACLFLSYRQKKNSNIKSSDVDYLMNVRNFKYYLRNVITNVHIDTSILGEFRDEWENTFIRVSNSLYNINTIVSKLKRSNFCLYSTKRYNFYQISSYSYSKKNNVCKEIFNAYNKCIKSENLPFPPNMAKWNPSDIWAANILLEYDICNRLRSCNNMNELNECINSFFRSRDLVGISLKKVVKDDINIIINHMTDPPVYKFNSVKVSENSLNTISVDIVANINSFAFNKKIEYMTIRSFDTSKGSDISGEVKGISAQQGKISLTQINKILLSYGIETVPTIKASDSNRNPHDYEPLSKLTDEELQTEIDLINQLVIAKYGNVTSKSIDKKLSRGRLYSKYQSLYLAWILSDISDRILLNKIISDMFYYALSIKFDGIRTPMYVRVID
jgi:hypothetical protein